MSQVLYLSANLVPQTLVYGHLQIVYEDADGNLLENETTSPGFPYFFGDWEYPTFGQPHDDPNNTPGYGDPNDYAIVPLELRPDQTAEHVWELMGQIHFSLSSGDHGLNYDIDQNSNSYVSTVLWVVGIDIDDYLSDVTPPTVFGFPGVETNILQGAATGGFFSGNDTPIPLALPGTDGNDFIRTGIGEDTLRGASGNDEIYSGDGSDDVRGGGGQDMLFGEGGADLLIGGAGRDLMEGGAGNDGLLGTRGHDELFGDAGDDDLRGGSGRDLIDGGTGDDVMTGGTGADVFVFQDGSGSDTITDFDPNLDVELIDLRLVTEITDLDDLIDNHLSQVGADAVIDAGGGDVITLTGVDIDDLKDGDDFLI